MTLTGLPQFYDIDPLSTLSSTNLVGGTITPEMTTGSIGYTRKGDKFRFVKAGAVTLVVGNLIQSAAYDTNQVDLAVLAAAAGQNTISVTVGATITANQYAGGKLVVSITPGLGQTFTIKSHPAVASAATGVFILEENITTALTTSSKVTLTPDPWSAVIQSPTTRTGRIVGAAVSAIPNAGFGWVACEGDFAVLCDATVPTSVGNYVSPSTSTAGCVTKAVTLIDCIGTFYQVGVSAQTETVSLRIF